LVHDWKLKTNLEGLYAAGDQLFASNCHGHAAATGYYAGRHAAEYTLKASESKIDPDQVQAEKTSVYSPVNREKGIGWKELNAGLARLMQNYCGHLKSEELLQSGLSVLNDLEENEASTMYASNPHGLVRALEVRNIFINARIVLHSCLARKASSKQLHFIRQDYPRVDPPEWHKYVTVKLMDNDVQTGDLPLDFYGEIQKNYERHNQSYLKENSG
jgi:succinate dehydrogenase/fumarate reductase flavoprotein subunit